MNPSIQQHLIARLLKDRILILDGAMGTMIQKHKPDEKTYRGERFKDFAHDVKGIVVGKAINQPGLSPS
jgi:5-methyltetrahydrofolate--homocysteine methyltransferase